MICFSEPGFKAGQEPQVFRKRRRRLAPGANLLLAL